MSKEEEMYKRIFELEQFVDEITCANGRYSYLNGTRIVLDAYEILHHESQTKPSPHGAERTQRVNHPRGERND